MLTFQTRVIATLLLLTLVDCACRKSDAERAREERAKVEQKLRDSITLFPYRFIKLALRSKASPNRPACVDKLIALVDETEALPERPATAEEAAKVAKTYARLLAALSEARNELKTRDEDEFPLLWQAVTQTPPPARYDQSLEHLDLATFWVAVDIADRSGRVPGSTEYPFYELSRAVPQPGWGKELSALVQLERGTAFCANGYHFAAEEELNLALETLERLPPSERSPFLVFTGEEVHRGLLATGYLVRGWNRHALGRDEPSTDDLVKALEQLDALGIDNELTDWTWAVVETRRHHYEAAAARLEKLAASAHVSEESRAQLDEAARAMRQHGQALPVLLESRATAIVVQALIARAGGMRHIISVLAGEGVGDKVYRPLDWLERTRRNLTPDAATFIEQAKHPLKALEEKFAGPTDSGK